MDDDKHIPEEVTSFLATHIDSVYRLEILLFLLEHRELEHTPESVARELRLSPEPVARELQALSAQGLLESSGGPSPSFRYQPRSEALGRTILQLERLYAERRTSIITLIYSRPNEKLRGFADAFKIRKDS